MKNKISILSVEQEIEDLNTMIDMLLVVNDNDINNCSAEQKSVISDLKQQVSKLQSTNTE